MTTIDLRGVPRALFVGGAGLRQRLEAWDSAIRGPVGSVRRVGFVHAQAGAGATTVAREVLRIAATRRDAPVLAVDASASGELARQLGAGETPSNDVRELARTSEDAVTGLVSGPEGQRVLRPPRTATDPARAWLDEAAPIVRFFDVAVTDFGRRDPLTDMAACAALSDVVCLVSPADRSPGELSRILGAAAADLPEHPRVVLALVDRRSTARRAPEAIARTSAFPVVRIPADAGLARGAGARALRTRAALLQLAAALIAGGGES